MSAASNKYNFAFFEQFELYTFQKANVITVLKILSDYLTYWLGGCSFILDLNNVKKQKLKVRIIGSVFKKLNLSSVPVWKIIRKSTIQLHLLGL